jgi:hypothetical protein
VAERNSFDSEDGEELGDVDDTAGRRVLDQQRGSHADSTRRLSRESVGRHPLLRKPLANQVAAWKKDLWMIAMRNWCLTNVESGRLLGNMALDLARVLGKARLISKRSSGHTTAWEALPAPSPTGTLCMYGFFEADQGLPFKNHVSGIGSCL